MWTKHENMYLDHRFGNRGWVIGTVDQRKEVRGRETPGSVVAKSLKEIGCLERMEVLEEGEREKSSLETMRQAWMCCEGRCRDSTGARRPGDCRSRLSVCCVDFDVQTSGY